MTKTAAGASPVDCHVRPLVERLRFAALPGTNRHALDEEAAEEIERLRSERDVQDAALVCLRADLRDCATARDAELERLHRALHEIAEEWAGAECGEPVHAQEAYAIALAKRMYALAAAALRPNAELRGRPLADGPA